MSLNLLNTSAVMVSEEIEQFIWRKSMILLKVKINLWIVYHALFIYFERFTGTVINKFSYNPLCEKPPAGPIFIYKL